MLFHCERLFRFISKRFIGLLFLASLILTSTAQAVEIYSALTQKCQLVQGLIVDVTEDNVVFLTLEGQSKRLPRDDVRFLVIHNTLENPVRTITLDDDLKSRLRAIYLEDSSEPVFYGWAVRFVEDLVIFYDLKGKTYVLEMYNIRKIRPAGEGKKGRRRLKGTSVQLRLGDVSSHCSNVRQSEAKGGLRPTRILGDQIQISEFMSNFEEGYEHLVSFQERTYLYAKPYLYEKRTKLGFPVYGKYKEGPPSNFPMYFQWATGDPFRFQSFSQIGTVTNEYGPTIEPMFLFRSDLKSHIFTGTFVGNLLALPAGSEYFTRGYEDNFGIKYGNKKNKSHSATAFNYMALMGGDWGPWSFSIGTYFPIFAFRVRDENASVDEFREILANKVSPIFRVMFTRNWFKARVLYSQTRVTPGGSFDDLTISIDEDISARGVIESFQFKGHYLRVGADIQIKEDLHAGAEGVIVRGEYSETLLVPEKNSMDFTQLKSQFYLRHWFGEYVTLRAYVNYFNVHNDYKFSGISGEDTIDESVMGGAFEFVF